MQGSEKVKKKKMTLKSYYEALPRYTAPRLEFIKEVSTRCGTTEQSVRNWCLYGIKPQKIEHIKVLSELTGISISDLWES